MVARQLTEFASVTEDHPLGTNAGVSQRHLSSLEKTVGQIDQGHAVATLRQHDGIPARAAADITHTAGRWEVFVDQAERAGEFNLAERLIETTPLPFDVAVIEPAHGLIHRVTPIVLA